ncbi:hypothetical protein LX36DRAFT_19317 [Colletotrichum falcatum]|nr:hypothetical protein LX36DRAFT_19317 [Colletotrichum falcatum]
MESLERTARLHTGTWGGTDVQQPLGRMNLGEMVAFGQFQDLPCSGRPSLPLLMTVVQNPRIKSGRGSHSCALEPTRLRRRQRQGFQATSRQWLSAIRASLDLSNAKNKRSDVMDHSFERPDNSSDVSSVTWFLIGGGGLRVRFCICYPALSVMLQTTCLKADDQLSRQLVLLELESAAQQCRGLRRNRGGGVAPHSPPGLLLSSDAVEVCPFHHV